MTREQTQRFGASGPALQTAMFSDGTMPREHEIRETAATVRRLFAAP